MFRARPFVTYSKRILKYIPPFFLIKYGMWKKTVTIDKKFGREYGALLRELDKNKSVVFAAEEGKSRRFLSIAAKESDAESADDFVCAKVARLLTTYFKHAFLKEKLGVGKVNAAQASLLAVMIYYDCEGDRDEIFDMLKGYDVISVDGVFNFAMRDIKRDWEELAAISENLFDGFYDDEDLYDVAGYVVEEKTDRSRFLIADAKDPVVTDLVRGGFVTVDDLYGDNVLNLINCVVGNGAKEVTLDASFRDRELIGALSRFAKVRSI